ncbi:hypothetical protein [Priestia megaterium]|uniref:hypothetical protein n=1 Tax=Priestia megaterium TaxID=1404 RepID=UPI0022B91835|nr:hypothetical protein [Priestia megaterium]MCZ8493609.1 hypothetical protein [Priestia megaterium]WDC90836.1 hypothetical protein PSR56_12590 [Priestia megaterium]
MTDLVIYMSMNVPDNLFTRNELSKMGLIPVNPQNPDAMVNYEDQKREYNLYLIEKTRTPKRQKGFSLVSKDSTVEEILEKRRKRTAR